MPIPSSDLVTVPRFNHIMKHLSVWRNADHEDNLALCRSDVIEIIEGVKTLESLTQSDVGRTTKEDVQGSIADGQQCNEHQPQELSPAKGWAAWHPVHGFGQMPNAFSDIDDAIDDAKCHTILDDSPDWKAVPVEIKRVFP